MSTTPYSYRTYAGDGSSADFSVPFPYLKRAHVQVKVDGALKVDGTDYNWTSDVQVQFTAAPASGAEILVIRETPDSDQIVLWQNGSYVIAEDLNESDLQWLYLIQEHEDRLNDVDGIIGPAKATITTAQATKDPTDPAWDDKSLATAGAIKRVFKQVVGDGAGFPGSGNKAINGQIRIDNSGAEPALFYWDSEAATPAWVEIKVDGAVGPPGPIGPIGPAPGLQSPPATATNVPNESDGSVGDATANVTQDADKNLLFSFGIPVGERGPKGDTGNDGTDGTDGAAATIQVGTTTTGPAGSDASVVNSGSTSAAVFNFTIPKGDQGIQGIPGPDGPPGSGVNYKGPIDPTSAAEPSPKENGDLYVSTASGTSSWTGLSTVSEGMRLVWNDYTNKWDAYESINAVNLGYSKSAVNGVVTNDQGANATLPLADGDYAGLMSPGHKTKLDGIQEGAQVNPDLSKYLQEGSNISLLNNDAGYITAAEVPDTGVTSVNGDTGPIVVLDAADVGALPDDTSLDFVPLGSWDDIPALSSLRKRPLLDKVNG